MKPTERAFLIFYSKVLLREARARNGAFAHFLLNAAFDAGRRAAATPSHLPFRGIAMAGSRQMELKL